MTIRNISEAKAELSALLVLAENGEEVVISRAGKPIAKIVPIKGGASKRKPGILKGKIKIADDFDAPDPEFEAAFYGDGT
jgi:prevent-host-death family protein